MFTREDIRDLLDSGRPGEGIADILMKYMHTGFSDHTVVQEILRRRTAAYEAYIPTGEGKTAEQIISEEKARALILHIEQMADRLADRPHLAIQLPTILGPAVPARM